ncbi:MULTISPECIES: SDR family oxidoreductase [unclassified Mycobacterium]|uniref:SDR family NAD(P)-dependent oxidoreductase n=1 Tax=unclassified Mycobacterium TaxID=2642494 RepID=UPI0029C8F460|nr:MULTISPECIES: SDR family oxidoreductase [unclassified Mycobacterium]
MRLKDRVAVITGGASGIGFASALRFLQEDAAVVIADYNAATGEAAESLARRQGFHRVDFIRTDVSKEADVEAMIARAVDHFGGVDIVFNNAGITGAIGPLTETTVEDWDFTFDIIVKGVFLGIKHAARVMRARGTGGVIINTSSIGGFSGDAGPLAYSAAKAAVINLTRSAAVELAPDRIRVNAICPGFIATPLAAGGADISTVEGEFATKQPWPEAGLGDHVAGAALFLASDDATFVTGESLVVDGGLLASGPGVSREIPEVAGRNLKIAGVHKGSIGEEHELRVLEA